jgi:hypothetical protein
MWKKSFLEDSHPDSLVLVSLEFSQFFVFLRSVTRLWDAEDWVCSVLLSTVLIRFEVVKILGASRIVLA